MTGRLTDMFIYGIVMKDGEDGTFLELPSDLMLLETAYFIGLSDEIHSFFLFFVRKTVVGQV